MQIVSFKVDDGLYGIPVLLVEEFFRSVKATPVPLSDPRIEGLIHHRGKTATVLDMRQCLQKPPLSKGRPSKMILLETSEELTPEAKSLGINSGKDPVALRVDSTGRIFNAKESDILPRPAHIPFSFVDGVIRSDDNGYMMVLNICNLIESILEKQA